MMIPRWVVSQGEHVFLHGESGSGKTTIMNLISGILLPSEGSIHIFGEDICAMSNRKRDLYRAKNIGVVFQRFNLISYLSVLKNIELATYLAKNTSIDTQSEALALLNKLQLPRHILQQQVGQLSVGQQQRVAIARALINKPRLLLVDEPTSALDASARDAFMQVLMELCGAHNTTLVFVSHDAYLQRHFAIATDIHSLLAHAEEA
jgi:putative ABC transport system ATP-binding protein